MSVPVALDRLRSEIDARGPAAYVLTVSDDGSPHAVHASLRWEGDALATEVGRRSAANATARRAVSLLYTVRAGGDYSLIVDGTAVVVPGEKDNRLLVTPTRAVLHRAAATPEAAASSCGADCVPVLPATKP